MKKLPATAALFSLLLAATPAMAQGWDAEGWYLRHGFGHHTTREVYFDDDDRAVIRGYISRHRYFCPFGTVPHPDGCAEPPANVVFYRPGEVLPQTVTYTELPSYVVANLAPPPPGAIYVRAGDDVYLMSERDRTILDAINLFADLN